MTNRDQRTEAFLKNLRNTPAQVAGGMSADELARAGDAQMAQGLLQHGAEQTTAP